MQTSGDVKSPVCHGELPRIPFFLSVFAHHVLVLYRSRVEELKAAFRKAPSRSASPPAALPKVARNGAGAPPTGRSAGSHLAKLGLQGRVLLQRSWRQIKRDKATTVARLMSNVSSAVIFGSIYWRMGRQQVGIQNRMGLLQARPPSEFLSLHNLLLLSCRAKAAGSWHLQMRTRLKTLKLKP